MRNTIALILIVAVFVGVLFSLVFVVPSFFSGAMEWVGVEVSDRVSEEIRGVFRTTTVTATTTDVAPNRPLDNPLGARNFQQFLQVVINFLFWFGLAVAPVFFIVSAFYFMTAAGNTAQIETGKRIITYTLFGLLIIIMAMGAVELVLRIFLD